ncbi:Alpha-pyrone synthesis polyketide synthase-like Pks18 [Hirsutella minnesotensis 3608]|uniref:Alpha-pyrone synthesis polyketide synthase-like Pks18 n=1 Tax=Hirsutella minnesotensis 3608 TaxID=1043627 RepID=A0A0F7ZVP0_9HYPO|nr:Alpha-pyrone synthesis polyketide synthase-like Pks18 [Hirsutella minnesotensis 3608]
MAPMLHVPHTADIGETTRGGSNNVTSEPRNANRITSRQVCPVRTLVIEGIATGVPQESTRQKDAAEKVCALFQAEPAQQERINRLYTKTQIDKRHMTVDPLQKKFDRSMSIRQRMDLFLQHASPLAIDVSSRALDKAQATAEDIGLLVLVTSTGFIAPGVDVTVMKALGLSPSVSRVTVNFMGCAAAMNGLRAATDFVRAHPRSKALMCCVELSSVNAVFANNINDVIISSLFADGCAAMVVGSRDNQEGQDPLRPGQVIVHEHFCQFVEGSEDGITLGVNDNGITCELSAKLPKYIRSGLGPVVCSLLDRHGMTKSDVNYWAIHPGGPKIIEESVCSLDIPAHVATKSWDVLAEYGNMLSASLPFVLQRMVDEANSEGSSGKGVAFSFAPGVTVEGILFEIPECT